MNYLQLCQGIVSELGLSGGSPTTLSAVTGNTILELNNVTRWIHDSALQLDNLWQDWKYLWNQYTGSALAGAQTLPAPTGTPPPIVQLWDINKVRYRATGTTQLWQPVSYYSRSDLLLMFDPDNAVPTAPQGFTIQPDNTFFFGAPFDVGYDFKTEFWRRPIELLANADTPSMPPQYHRIILCRAAVMYGNREDAPEIINGLETEYIDMLDKLQSDQLEGWALRRTSTDRERPTRNISLSDYLR